MDVFKKLEECTDYSIYKRDWPRHGFQYEVRVWRFFAYGSGVGITLENAINRALKHMEKNDSKIRYATDEEMNEIFNQKEKT